MKNLFNVYCLIVMNIIVIIFSSNKSIFAENNIAYKKCVEEAVKRTLAIRALPEKKFILSLDGQNIFLEEFYIKCNDLFPWCTLFEKFYYWDNNIKTITSISVNGEVTHKIRCYYRCISKCHQKRRDPCKIHGDVAEFYDGNSKFMGIAVYVGNGNYCSLPYSGYQK